jgi:ryanodine receptor 2
VIYQPAPIDVSRVILPPSIEMLTEKLAENAHELWALNRLRQGWTYGSSRDDDRKQHPCLVPYDQLPESEKEYDRIAAIQTLKAILALGYRVEQDM